MGDQRNKKRRSRGRERVRRKKKEEVKPALSIRKRGGIDEFSAKFGEEIGKGSWGVFSVSEKCRATTVKKLPPRKERTTYPVCLKGIPKGTEKGKGRRNRKKIKEMGSDMWGERRWRA